LASLPDKILIATFLPMMGWTALYTVPIRLGDAIRDLVLAHQGTGLQPGDGVASIARKDPDGRLGTRGVGVVTMARRWPGNGLRLGTLEIGVRAVGWLATAWANIRGHEGLAIVSRESAEPLSFDRDSDQNRCRVS